MREFPRAKRRATAIIAADPSNLAGGVVIPGVAVQSPSSPPVTALLQAWSAGDRTALDRLVPLVHAELRRLARRYMRRERAGHTLQTTALIHEAYIRLVEAQGVNWQNRAHFFGISARVMRQVLVDFARERGYRKRGGGESPRAARRGAARR